MVVIVVQHKLIQVLYASSQILNRHVAILVKIKSHPAVLDEYLDIFIVMLNVLSDFGLVFLEDLDEERDVVGWLVVDNVEVVLEGIVQSVVEESV